MLIPVLVSLWAALLVPAGVAEAQETGVPRLASISPSTFLAGSTVRVTLRGLNLQGVQEVFVGERALSHAVAEADAVELTLPSDLAPGSYLLRVRTPGGTSNGVLVEVFSAQIGGRVVLGGEPVAGRRVSLVRRVAGFVWPGEFGFQSQVVATQLTRPNGSFQFIGVGEGAYQVVVEGDPGAGFGRLVQVAVDVDVSLQDLRQELGALDLGARLEMSAHLGPEARVVADELTVNTSEWERSGLFTLMWSAETALEDSRGHFHLQSPAGEGTISVPARGGAAILDEAVRRRISSGAYRSAIELVEGVRHVVIGGPVLRFAPGVLGGVVTGNGVPLAGVDVHLSGPAGLVERSVADAAGAFRFAPAHGLPAGEYWLEVTREKPFPHAVARRVFVGAFAPEVRVAQWDVGADVAGLSSLRFVATSALGEARRLAPGDLLDVNRSGLEEQPVRLSWEAPGFAAPAFLEVPGAGGRSRLLGVPGALRIGVDWLPPVAGEFPSRLRVVTEPSGDGEIRVAGPVLAFYDGLLRLQAAAGISPEAVKVYGPRGEVALATGEAGGVLIATGVVPGEYRGVYAPAEAGPGELEYVERTWRVGSFGDAAVTVDLLPPARSLAVALRWGDHAVEEGDAVSGAVLTDATPLVLTWGALPWARSVRVVNEAGDVIALAGAVTAGGSTVGGSEIGESTFGESADVPASVTEAAVWDLAEGARGFAIEAELADGVARYRGPTVHVQRGEVRGRAVRRAEPLAGMAVLVPAVDGLGDGGTGRERATRGAVQPLGPDGSFTFADISPGEYRLIVWAARMPHDKEPHESSVVTHYTVPLSLAAVGRPAPARTGSVVVDVGTLEFDVEADVAFALADPRSGKAREVAPGGTGVAAPGEWLSLMWSLGDFHPATYSFSGPAEVTLEHFGRPLSRWRATGAGLTGLTVEYPIEEYGEYRTLLSLGSADGGRFEIRGPAIGIRPASGAPIWTQVHIAGSESGGRSREGGLDVAFDLLIDGIRAGEFGSGAFSWHEIPRLQAGGPGPARMAIPLERLERGGAVTVDLSLAYFETVVDGERAHPLSVVVDNGVRQGRFTLDDKGVPLAPGYAVYRFVLDERGARMSRPDLSGPVLPGVVEPSASEQPLLVVGFGEAGERLGLDPAAEVFVRYVAVSTDGAFDSPRELSPLDLGPVAERSPLQARVVSVAQESGGSLRVEWEAEGAVEREWVAVRERATGRVLAALPRSPGRERVQVFTSLPAGEYVVSVAATGPAGEVAVDERPVLIVPYWSQVTSGSRVFSSPEWRTGGWAVFTIGERLALSAERGFDAWAELASLPAAAGRGVTVEVAASGPGRDGALHFELSDGRAQAEVVWTGTRVVVQGVGVPLPPASGEVRYRVVLGYDDGGSPNVMIYRNDVPLLAAPIAASRNTGEGGGEVGGGGAFGTAGRLVLRQKHSADGDSEVSFSVISYVAFSTAGGFSPLELGSPGRVAE